MGGERYIRRENTQERDIEKNLEIPSLCWGFSKGRKGGIECVKCKKKKCARFERASKIQGEKKKSAFDSRGLAKAARAFGYGG